jgi:Rrf2 family cysteine metabolism transcriptional repressor
MMISTRSRYALRALIDLVRHYNGTPVLLKDIAGREGISQRYLENIFTQLRTAGILKSSKGRNGGFYPARTPERICLLDIVESLENDTSVCSCIDEPGSCGRADSCVSRDAWVAVNKSFRRSLASVCLSDLVWEKEKPGMRGKTSGI